MSIIEYNGRKIRVDNNGYLSNQEDWDEEIAKALALEEGLAALTSEQMDIIRFMRKYYFANHVFPMLNQVCRLAHQPKQCVSSLFVNPEKAWKIAGLPKQEGVHFVTMDGEHYFMEPYC